jgi:hypothetical protein
MHNEELQNFCFSPDTVRLSNQRESEGHLVLWKLSEMRTKFYSENLNRGDSLEDLNVEETDYLAYQGRSLLHEAKS